MDWDQETKKKFQLFISKMPLFHRRITEEAVIRTTEEVAKKRGSASVGSRMWYPLFLRGPFAIL